MVGAISHIAPGPSGRFLILQGANPLWRCASDGRVNFLQCLLGDADDQGDSGAWQYDPSKESDYEKNRYQFNPTPRSLRRE